MTDDTPLAELVVEPTGAGVSYADGAEAELLATVRSVLDRRAAAHRTALVAAGASPGAYRRQRLTGGEAGTELAVWSRRRRPSGWGTTG